MSWVLRPPAAIVVVPFSRRCLIPVWAAIGARLRQDRGPS